MEKLFPWLIVAWLLYGRKRGPSTATPTQQQQPPTSPKPPPLAYIYQLPDDGYATVRMAFGQPDQPPREMGIFGSEAEALKVAKSKGWQLAWQGTRQLSERP